MVRFPFVPPQCAFSCSPKNKSHPLLKPSTSSHCTPSLLKHCMCHYRRLCKLSFTRREQSFPKLAAHEMVTLSHRSLPLPEQHPATRSTSCTKPLPESSQTGPWGSASTPTHTASHRSNSPGGKSTLSGPWASPRKKRSPYKVGCTPHLSLHLLG